MAFSWDSRKDTWEGIVTSVVPTTKSRDSSCSRRSRSNERSSERPRGCRRSSDREKRRTCNPQHEGIFYVVTEDKNAPNQKGDTLYRPRKDDTGNVQLQCVSRKEPMKEKRLPSKNSDKNEPGSKKVPPAKTTSPRTRRPFDKSAPSTAAKLGFSIFGTTTPTCSSQRRRLGETVVSFDLGGNATNGNHSGTPNSKKEPQALTRKLVHATTYVNVDSKEARSLEMTFHQAMRLILVSTPVVTKRSCRVFISWFFSFSAV